MAKTFEEDPHRHYQWWKNMQCDLVPSNYALGAHFPDWTCSTCIVPLPTHYYFCPKCWPHPHFCAVCFDEHVQSKHGVVVPS